ncbi:MAG: CusA/CzcA family heavy metal efflux RND transporter [Cytophagaceae bacterium]
MKLIDDLIAFSIRNKLVTGIMVLALVVWGVYSLSKLPIDAVPDITNNQVQVITTAPTLAAQEIEKYITYPVEIALATIPDVVEVRSISRFGLSVVTIVFKDHVNILDARQHVSERIRSAQTQIPPGYGVPEMAPISTGLSEIYQYTIRAKEGYENKFSTMDLRTIQDWIVKRQLLGTPGIADVSSFGGNLRQYEIAIDPSRLRGMGVTIPELFEALQKNNQNTGGAYIDKKPNAYFIRSVGLVKGKSDLETVVVKNVNGVPLLIRDVAEIRYGSAVRYGAMTRNNEGEAVGGLVLMLKGENSSQVIKNVKERIDKIEKSLPEGLYIDPFLDRSELVDRTITTVSKNLIEGGLIVVFVLVLLLGNFRAGLVVASVIPLSMLFAIAMMNVFGISGNLMSLGAIDFGIIVDGAVIIVESIVHRISKINRTAEISQQELDEEVLGAAVKIRKSAAFGEIIILIVYLPILTLSGIEGKMFTPMAQTVSFAILGAFILSLTYVPMMSALVLKGGNVTQTSISDRIINFCQKIYNPLLVKSLKHKKTVVGTAIALTFISLFTFSGLGGEFLPTLEEGDFAVETRLLSGSSLSQTIETSQKAADILLKNFPEVKQVIGKIGTAEIPTDPMPIEACDLMVILKDKSEWVSASGREELAEKMNDALSVIPGVEFGFQQPIQMRFNELMTGVRQDIAVKIFGEDLDELSSKAQKAADLISKKQGVGDIYVEKVTGLPQIVVKFKRENLARYGLNINDVNSIVRTAFAGEVAGLVFDGEKRFELVVRLKESLRENISDVKSLYIPIANGQQIPITEVAEINYEKGPMQISREDAKRRITIGINVRNRDVESLVNEIQETLDSKLKLKPGYYVTYGGQFENLLEAKNRLAVAVPVALALIFMLLYFTFGSVKQTIMIFTAIPFAAVGGIFALYLRDMPFSISAGIGFIALFGVAVLNGIVLISCFNQLEKDGMSDVTDRIFEGTKERLRPVIMTAAVASLGFLPMALSGSAGAEVQKPLATVVIGGLVTSTILTLLVLPVLYSYSEKNRSGNTGNISLGKAGVFLLPLLLPVISYAQQPRTLNVEEAVNIALENNPNIRAVSLESERHRVLRRSAVELPTTNLSFVYGNYNSFEVDNSFSISQNFGSPLSYARNVQLSDQLIKSAELRLSVSKNQLQREVRIIFYQCLVAEEMIKLFRYQDSIYKNFSRSADLRYRTGESNYLEKLTADSRLMEVQNALFQAQADADILRKQLGKLLNISEDVICSGSSVEYSPVFSGQGNLEANPILISGRQQVEVAKLQTKLFRSAFFPEINFGVTSHTLIGFYRQHAEQPERFYGRSDRFHYVFGGIGIPLWMKPARAKIKASELNEQVAQYNFQNQKLLLETEAERLKREYQKLERSREYYISRALPQSASLIQFAEKGYRSGESGYLEYIQSLTEAMQIRRNYLNTINQFNQVKINLDYLLGGN